MTGDTPDTWPKHPDGTNMTIGEMPEEDRKRIMREAAARYKAKGGELSSLCESVQDAVNEVIRVCREHGRCERNFPDLRIQVYAYPHASGNGVAWGINSLVSGINTRRGIVR